MSESMGLGRVGLTLSPSGMDDGRVVVVGLIVRRGTLDGGASPRRWTWLGVGLAFGFSGLGLDEEFADRLVSSKLANQAVQRLVVNVVGFRLVAAQRPDRV